VGGPSNAGGNRGRGNAPSSLPGNPGGPRGNNPGNGPDNNNRGNSDSRGNSQRGNSADNKPDTAGPKDPEGFKNYGQYVAAKHVSDNLGIAFGDLKKSMVDDKMSLGESIHKFRPNLSQKEVDDHARKAEDAGKKAEEEEARKKDKSSE
jgi:hypothetical protein